MEQLQKDPFFSAIDWKKLELKQLDPPQVLNGNKAAGSQAKRDMTEEDVMMFETSNQDEQRGGLLAHDLLADEDYTEDNKTYNRVKNYSFARTAF